MRRRRGRDTGRTELLLERDAERAVIVERLDDAQAGVGAVVVIEGPAGKGKSRLMTIAGDLARARGFRLLGAYGAELEVHFPFGAAIQLFEPWWLSGDASRRHARVDDPADPVVQLLQRGTAGPDADGGYAAVHGLFRLTARLARDRGDGDEPAGLLMLVDDAHWADGPSLRFLAYLAGRVSELPVLLVAAVRQGEASADPQALAALRMAAAESGSHLRLRALSDAAVAAITRSEFPDAEEGFCAAAARVTNGNPFLLIELLAQVRADGRAADAATASHLEGLAPESVLAAVVGRLGSAPPAVGAVARAVSVLGDGAPLRRVARVAELDLAQAARAADALADMNLLFPGEPLSFIHPLIRHAVEQSMSPLDRGQAHRRAARVLADAGASDDAVASQLLMAPVEADGQAVATLRRAAARAVASGDRESPVKLLRRALDEDQGELRAELLAELAEAEAAADVPEAPRTLRHAIEATRDPRRRSQLMLRSGVALYRQGAYREAERVLARGLAEAEHDAVLAGDLRAARVAALSLMPDRDEDAERAAREMLVELRGQPGPLQQAALAHVALHRANRGAARATISRLVEQSWNSGRLLEGDLAPDASWPLLSGALLLTDELERDLELCAAIDQAGERPPAARRALVERHRACALYERGEIDAALAAAQASVDASPDADPSGYRTAYGVIACCHIQHGRLDAAEAALAVLERPDLLASSQLGGLMLARALLRLAQRQPDAALADALRAREHWEANTGPTPGGLPWRSTAALAHLALGRSDEARALAGEELRLGQEADARRVVVRNLRVLGLAEGGQEGLDRLAQAVRLGADHPQRLDYLAALLALGGALRRANQRAAARDPLREAAELARRSGATVLAEQALEELRATGARRRISSRWGPEALTPSERRVAELAADGLTTRAIAEMLYVTPKTVEFHLRHIYQKLGVNSRDRLSGALRNSR